MQFPSQHWVHLAKVSCYFHFTVESMRPTRGWAGGQALCPLSKFCYPTAVHHAHFNTDIWQVNVGEAMYLQEKKMYMGAETESVSLGRLGSMQSRKRWFQESSSGQDLHLRA